MALGDKSEDWAEEKAAAAYDGCRGLTRDACINVLAACLREVQKEFSGPLSGIVRAQARDLASFRDQLNKAQSQVKQVTVSFDNERKANESLQAALHDRDREIERLKDDLKHRATVMEVWTKAANPPFVVWNPPPAPQVGPSPFVGYLCTCQACGAQFIHNESVGYCPKHSGTFRKKP